MEQQILSQGAVLGGRFEVVALAGEGDFGRVYKARDVKLDKTIALRVISAAMVSAEVNIDVLRLRIREASALTHRNIRATFGMGVESDGSIFVASEWIEGQNLRSLLTKRSEAGKRFSFKGAYNIIGHVCNALNYAHKTMYHGALSPRTIMVSSAGRVKVSDWGLCLVRTSADSYFEKNKVEAAFLAPEALKKTESMTVKADIYSLGTLFYELVTGVAPTRPLKAPSLLGFSKEVDAVVARCMAADPNHRYADANEVKAAIAKIVETPQAGPTDQSEAIFDDDLGIDIDVDLTVLKRPGPALAAPLPPPPPPPAPVGPGSMLQAKDLPPPPGRADSGPPITDGRASTIDMGAVISGLGKSEAARWMVQKDKFDHGPFTDRELVQMILLGEVVGKYPLLNMDTGVRKKVKAWGHFDEYLERYRLKKKEEDERKEKVRTQKAEKRGSAFMVIVTLGILGFIGLVVGGYFLSRTLRKEKTYTPEEMIAALDSGEIKLRTGGNLIDKERKRGKGSRRAGGGGGGGGGGGAGGSFEDAMNMAIDIGGLANTGGQEQLSPQVITNIMDRNVRRFLPCMAGQSVKRVDMDIAIAGDGRVMGVSVKQGDAKLQNCVKSKVNSIKFPTSPAPRTGASWYFELY